LVPRAASAGVERERGDVGALVARRARARVRRAVVVDFVVGVVRCR
jgi:hypothetical protein